MRNIAIMLAAVLIGGTVMSASSFAQSRSGGGTYHQDRMSDGTRTGPLGSDTSNGG